VSRGAQHTRTARLSSLTARLAACTPAGSYTSLIAAVQCTRPCPYTHANRTHSGTHSTAGLSVGRQPVVGVVLNPMMDELFAAAQGYGATLNGSPISVSDTLGERCWRPRACVCRRRLSKPSNARGTRTMPQRDTCVCD
jgi:hypothetical protein